MSKPTARPCAVAIKTAAPGKLQDGGGAILDRTASGGRWRCGFAGTGHKMGLGALPVVGLSKAWRPLGLGSGFRWVQDRRDGDHAALPPWWVRSAARSGGPMPDPTSSTKARPPWCRCAKITCEKVSAPGIGVFRHRLAMTAPTAQGFRVVTA